MATSVHHSMFGNEGALQSLCANIIIPNTRLREADEELFEDNPVDYIRGDIEGGDTDTRRRSALELVKGLRKHYESQVTTLFSNDITRMLGSYQQNPKKNWYVTKKSSVVCYSYSGHLVTLHLLTPL